jgi:hypothetical protein
MAKSKNDYTFEDIKAMLKQEKEKYDFEKAVEKAYSKKLTKQVKKAGHQAPGSLECFKDEHRFYSQEETRDYLQGSSYYENHQAMRSQDDY